MLSFFTDFLKPPPPAATGRSSSPSDATEGHATGSAAVEDAPSSESETEALAAIKILRGASLAPSRTGTVMELEPQPAGAEQEPVPAQPSTESATDTFLQPFTRFGHRLSRAMFNGEAGHAEAAEPVDRPRVGGIVTGRSTVLTVDNADIAALETAQRYALERRRGGTVSTEQQAAEEKRQFTTIVENILAAHGFVRRKSSAEMMAATSLKPKRRVRGPRYAQHTVRRRSTRLQEEAQHYFDMVATKTVTASNNVVSQALSSELEDWWYRERLRSSLGVELRTAGAGGWREPSIEDRWLKGEPSQASLSEIRRRDVQRFLCPRFVTWAERAAFYGLAEGSPPEPARLLSTAYLLTLTPATIDETHAPAPASNELP